MVGKPGLCSRDQNVKKKKKRPRMSAPQPMKAIDSPVGSGITKRINSLLFSVSLCFT